MSFPAAGNEPTAVAGRGGRHRAWPAGSGRRLFKSARPHLDICTMTAALHPPDDRQEPPAPAGTGLWPTAMSPSAPWKERLTVRSLRLRARKHVAIVAAITLLVAAGAAFGIWNITDTGHSGHATLAASNGDNGDHAGDSGEGDGDGGMPSPWTNYVEKEGSGHSITMAELHRAARQAAAIPTSAN